MSVVHNLTDNTVLGEGSVSVLEQARTYEYWRFIQQLQSIVTGWVIRWGSCKFANKPEDANLTPDAHIGLISGTHVRLTLMDDSVPIIRDP